MESMNGLCDTYILRRANVRILLYKKAGHVEIHGPSIRNEPVTMSRGLVPWRLAPQLFRSCLISERTSIQPFSTLEYALGRRLINLCHDTNLRLESYVTKPNKSSAYPLPWGGNCPTTTQPGLKTNTERYMRIQTFLNLNKIVSHKVNSNANSTTKEKRFQCRRGCQYY
jgi:hypothetical protein